MTVFQTKKSLGQHFLTSDVVPQWMCDAGAVDADDTVLEIGPGTGVLTREILARGARVIALEADARAIAVLNDTFSKEVGAGQLTIMHSDVRALDLSTLPVREHAYKVVANIPYYLSGFLFRSFLESKKQPNTLVFLVQKEVAARISKDKKESILSLSVKAFGSPTYVRSVSKGHFRPQPRIDSAIVRISDINRENFKTITTQEFFSLVHLGFGEKRKQLLGNLAKQFDRDTLIDAFKTLDLPETVRAEDVPLVKWLELIAILQKHNARSLRG